MLNTTIFFATMSMNFQLLWKQNKLNLNTVDWLVGFIVFHTTFNNISVIVAASFICGGNRSNRRKRPTCRKSLTNFIT